PASPAPQLPVRPAPAEVTLVSRSDKDTLIEPVHDPRSANGPDLIPEPKSVAKPTPAVRVVSPSEETPEAPTPRSPKPPSAEEPPVLQAFRCLLEKRPDEAVAWLGRYDKRNQDLLLYLLSLLAR